MQYKCACGSNCLSHIADDTRQAVIVLYDHRHKLRQRVEARGVGGARDELRGEFEKHYDKRKNEFSRSFVVGANGTCCIEAFTVGSGYSEGTYARARSDVTLHRPEHAGRVKQRTADETPARAELQAYVRHLKNGMERDKETGGHYHTPKDTDKNRWKIYQEGRMRMGLPTHGSCALLASVWKEHTEIRSHHARGHDACDTCAWFKAAIDGAVGETERAAMRKDRDEHIKFQLGERRHADDMWLLAEQQPQNYTMVILDAPTQNQLNIPTQVHSPRHPHPRACGITLWQNRQARARARVVSGSVH